MGEVYKSTHKFTSQQPRTLSFEANCLFTVVTKSKDGWWLVRNQQGKEGFVPATYLIMHQEAKKSGEPVYETIHAFTADQPGQLSVKQGERLYFLSKVTDGWWEVKNQYGKKGLVPSSYLRPSTVQEPVRSKSPSSENPTDDVLQSIDNAIQQIYDEAAMKNGMMTEQQRKTLATLTQHRQVVISRSRQAAPVETVKDESHLKPTRRAPPPPSSKENTPDPDVTDGRDEVPRIVKEEEVVEGRGKKEPTLEELNDVEELSSSSQPPVPPSLPLTFDVGVGVRLANAVRSQTGISFSESMHAAETTLRFVGTEIPLLSDTMDALIVALAASKISEDTDLKVESSDDLERLTYLLDKIRECRDDRQERSWAVGDDQGTIMEYLEEILKLLSDADRAISKAAIADSKYESVLVLMEYYQMELRWPIRLLLLQLFGTLFDLDQNVVSICVSGVLPNVLGKDIQESKDNVLHLLNVSLLCTMLFSTGELLPLTVYDQWSTEFITEVLDMIEDPPSCDTEDQVPDALVNVVLSFNQHFTDPDQNIVMDALKDNPNRKNFSEKLMLLINREEDPVCLREPLVPDSMTKFCLDLFSSKITAGLLYTSDLRVLIDIITRQLSDRAPGDQLRTHYLSLLHKLIGSTDYGESLHRRDTLTSCLSRIFSEEEDIKEDKKVIQQIWQEFPQFFQFVSSI